MGRSFIYNQESYLCVCKREIESENKNLILRTVRGIAAFKRHIRRLEGDPMMELLALLSGMSPRDIIICGSSSSSSSPFWFRESFGLWVMVCSSFGDTRWKMEGATKNARPPIGKRHNRHTNDSTGLDSCRTQDDDDDEDDLCLCDIPFSFFFFFLSSIFY